MILKKILNTLFLLSLTSSIALAQKDEIVTSDGIITLTPILHSTMVLEFNGKTVFTDPYGGAARFDGFSDPDLILITDIHGDHFNADTLKALNTTNTTFLVPAAVKDKMAEISAKQIMVIGNGEKIHGEGYTVEAIAMYNLPESADSRHPKGRGNGYVLTLAGKRIYISGDTDDITEMRALDNIDYAFVCMNPPNTMDVNDAADAVLEFKPKVVYPFHYRGGGGKYSNVEAFKKLVNDGDASIEVRLRDWYAEKAMLGEIEFPTSGAPDAKTEFIRGVLYLHSFEYAYAAVAFRQAQDIDPDFAMAYWGEAMTKHHSLWRVQSRQDAQDVLNRLGDTSEKRAAMAPTQREKDYVRAAEILFGMTAETKNLGKLERDTHYRNAMQQLHMAYPNDHEARVFFGLSILGVGSSNRNYASYMQAAAVLTPVWDANRSHPGAAHYLIHAYDDPVHAILGLPMARAYGKIAVGAAHAQHMTSHIYVALGLWDDMIAANLTALGVESKKTVGEGAFSREAWHHRYWLHYGRLQQGRIKDAEVIMRMARDRLSHDPLPREPAYYGAIYARYLFDTEKWGDAEKWLAPAGIDIPSPHYHFARAFAAVKLGQLDTARKLMADIRPGSTGNSEIILSPEEVAILKLELNAIFELAKGDTETALEMLRQAVKHQTSMPFRYGPPRISKPTAELLGDVLLELGRADQASLAYQDQLSRSQMRTHSLLGLARATARSGDANTSYETYGLLADIWHNADPDLPALAVVRSSAVTQ